MRILKEESICVVVDIQERLFPHIAENNDFLSKTVVLIEGLKLLKIPMIITQQYTKGLGATVNAVAEKLDVYNPIEKVGFSCCDQYNFSQKLEVSQKTRVIICGIESHICVMQTTIDLLDKGYTVIVIEDCVSSRKLADKQVAIERMRSEGAIISTCESILFELCRSAGNDTFKSISKLIK